MVHSRHSYRASPRRGGRTLSIGGRGNPRGRCGRGGANEHAAVRRRSIDAWRCGARKWEKHHHLSRDAERRSQAYLLEEARLVAAEAGSSGGARMPRCEEPESSHAIMRSRAFSSSEEENEEEEEAQQLEEEEDPRYLAAIPATIVTRDEEDACRKKEDAEDPDIELTIVESKKAIPPGRELIIVSDDE
ncbi:hypothetical protein BRADI_3g34634v3 [Brachypodium distachyon]|uniref:Uncharacterized protein n=1 Tax=Brachypodium distachyon TaxID=15368 RepID=A0A2K2D136_BRADI|nr:hypothetical protein BRADI_3g34634v3 [Brachypodium distachyon]